MPSSMKSLIAPVLLAVFLTGCFGVTRSVIAPGEPGGIPLATVGQTEAVAVMVTATPAAATLPAAAPLATDTPQTPPGEASATPVVETPVETAAAAGGALPALALPTFAPDRGELTSYVHFKIPFAFLYPGDWRLVDVDPRIAGDGGYTTTFTSPFEPGPGKQSEGLPEGVTKMDVSVNMLEQMEGSSERIPFDKAIELTRQGFTSGEFPSQILSEEEGTLPAGIHVVRWTLMPSGPAEGPIVYTLADIAENTITFVGIGDLELVDKIVASVYLMQ